MKSGFHRRKIRIPVLRKGGRQTLAGAKGYKGGPKAVLGKGSRSKGNGATPEKQVGTSEHTPAGGKGHDRLQRDKGGAGKGPGSESDSGAEGMHAIVKEDAGSSLKGYKGGAKAGLGKGLRSKGNGATPEKQVGTSEHTPAGGKGPDPLKENKFEHALGF